MGEGGLAERGVVGQLRALPAVVVQGPEPGDLLGAVRGNGHREPVRVGDQAHGLGSVEDVLADHHAIRHGHAGGRGLVQSPGAGGERLEELGVPHHRVVAPGADARPTQDQRDLGHDAVQGVAVLVAVPLPELLPVVAGEGDHRVLPGLPGLERVEQHAQGGVGLEDLLVVGGGEVDLVRVRGHDLVQDHAGDQVVAQGDVALARQAGGEGALERRLDLVVGVGLHGVQDQERRLVAAAEPVQSGLEGVGGGAVVHQAGTDEVVDVEPLLQVELRRHEGVVDPRARAVAPGLEVLGEGREVAFQTAVEVRVPVVAHDPVLAGVQAGEQRGGAGQGPGAGGVGPGEPGAVLDEGVEVRRGLPLVARVVHAIGPQGVDDDQHHVGALGVDPRRGAHAGDQRPEQHRPDPIPAGD